MLGRAGPYDVTVFGTQKARLYPVDNRAEKRVFAGPQFWDRAEREALAAMLGQSKPDGMMYFVDAGANVGLYTLSLCAAAGETGTQLRGLAVECDPINGARLAFNLAASDARGIEHADVALSDTETVLQFRSEGLGNRGEARVVNDDGPGVIKVQARPLVAIVTDAGWPRIDAMKMDIEGQEKRVLSAFFAQADTALWPGLVILETGRMETTPALALMQNNGYRVRTRTGINAILTLEQARAPKEARHVEA